MASFICLGSNFHKYNNDNIFWIIKWIREVTYIRTYIFYLLKDAFRNFKVNRDYRVKDEGLMLRRLKDK